MRLKTIWTINSMSTVERLRRTWDLGFQKLATKLPVRLKYWVTIQQMAKASINSPNIPATPLEEIMKNLDAPKNLD